MTFDFIEDLDEYFCEKYANYDHICILKGTKCPKCRRRSGARMGQIILIRFPRPPCASLYSEIVRTFWRN